MDLRSAKDKSNTSIVTEALVHDQPAPMLPEETTCEQPEAQNTKKPASKPAQKRRKTKPSEPIIMDEIEQVPQPTRQPATCQTNRGMDQKLTQIIPLLEVQAARPALP